ncbi:MAG TPA: type II toxin-antitoxin system HipA family toxin [Gemmatimonadaceae bacterium]|nr:type II toxin-antitoxin system HipA family toxin [Gemmatimonadaceae bacterium]
MSAPTAFVSVELDGVVHRVGRLWAVATREREAATFEYEPEWLHQPERFALEPALTLGPGPFHTVSGRALFGSLGDSAPDRWGRSLVSRAERRRAAAEGRQPRTLREVDYLLGVADVARQGALRFARSIDGPFVAESGEAAVPLLIDLPRLLAATAHYEADDESDEDLRLLLAPGSSLGGARPKASVRDRDGHLSIAKFPSRVDDRNVVRWESVALTLARRGGIPTTEWRAEDVAGQDVLLLRRFDRVTLGRDARGTVSEQRVPFLSAMSMLDAVDRETHSYLEIADALREHGADTATDLADLWRRVVFNVLISNTDDHLRNHGFLYAGTNGWRLAPAYDLNPMPVDIRPRFLSTTIGVEDNASASLELALAVAQDFGLTIGEARGIIREVAGAVGAWREVAFRVGLSPAECDRMASAFEHKEMEAARLE